jgi:hypothetical protein
VYCPNPDCPDRVATGNPGEYRDDVVSCPVCGTELLRGSWEDLAAAPAAAAVSVDEAHWDDGGSAGEDVELLRTVDVAEADAIVAALDEARVPFWRRVEGPDGMVLGAGRSTAAPGAEHVVIVAARREAEALAVIEELRATARALEGDAGDELDWGEEEHDDPPVEERAGSGFLSKAITLVFTLLMLLGMAAVLKMVFGG